MPEPPKLIRARERRIVEEIVESAIRPTERWASLRFCPPYIDWVLRYEI